jgi:DNA-binding LacI/PurR family transcriptional regulator
MKVMANRNQVAKLAGVSVAAVSRVLNNSGYVSQEKRERVMAAVRELEYHPNPIAKSLKRNRSHQLLFYIRDLSNNYYMEMYKGMLETANAEGYMVLISGGFDSAQIRSMMVDGVVLPTEEFTTPEFIGDLRIPMVAVTYSQKVHADIPNLDVDVRQAVRTAIEYLRSMGHERIGYVSSCKSNDEDPRQATYIEMLKPSMGEDTYNAILGGSVCTDVKYEIGYYEIGIAAGQDFLDMKPDITAIVCFNDASAIGFMSRIQSSGYRVPDDLSVVGIDGHFGGAYSSPPLTSVSISPGATGAECARILIDLVEGRRATTPPGAIEIKVIERSSVQRI